MIDELSSRSNLRKTISESQAGIEPDTWWLLRYSNHWATETQMASFRIDVIDEDG